ncbi:hypothetical protein LCGC14_2577460 [marine sediment metagenome]|uniref:Uncharacterized protein n=1 Tax=marine sediment metagenome TaxID=412755 RepID=A0A0F9B3D0_9ZZZZ
MEKSEVAIILTYLGVTGILTIGVGGTLLWVFRILIMELGTGASDPAMTAILGAMATGLVGGFGLLVQAIGAAKILEYLKDRLGTAKDKPEGDSE